MAIRRRSRGASSSIPEPSFALKNTAESRLLAEALRHLEHAERFTVLDLGPGTAATTEFFTRLNRPVRLIYIDSDELATLIVEQREKFKALEGSDPTFIDVVNLTRRHLDLPADLSIDLILLWDHLHRFDLEAVEALSSVLQPHIHPNTTGYGFGSLHSDQPIPANRYAIEDEHHISIGQAMSDMLPHAHSQQVLSEFFLALKIARGTLLQKGHLELLFET